MRPKERLARMYGGAFLIWVSRRFADTRWQGAHFHSPSIAENLHRIELTLVDRAEHIAACIRLTEAKDEAISPLTAEKLKSDANSAALGRNPSL
jgi:hypothetical protein